VIRGTSTSILRMTHTAREVMVGLASSMRPRQWLKNLLVLSAPLASGQITEGAVLSTSLWAFVLFCAASAAIYLVNDVLDRDLDRQHPEKRHRPIAAGVVPPTLALIVSAFLAAAAVGSAWFVRPEFAALVSGYLLMQAAYCLWWKHETVLDLSVISLGFLLRAVAGGVAIGIPLTTSFLLVSAFGSLFIVAGKRASELHSMGVEGKTRRVQYTDSYLRFVWTMAAAATVLSYAMWALEQSEHGLVLPWHAISVAPFVMGVLRYAVDVDAGRAGAPEDIVWADRRLQSLGVVWLVIVSLGIFGV
jgi:decaprenyl-phosphate phosphoribosyltransferase